MTTIAYKKGILSADTKVSFDDIHWANCSKIKKVKGWLIGAAGDWDYTQAFMNRFDPSYIINKSPLPVTSVVGRDHDFEAIMISPSGKIYYAEEGGIAGLLRTKGFIAIGSGVRVAMTAMELGTSSKDAIRMAMKYDINTGGRVQSVKLGG